MAKSEKERKIQELLSRNVEEAISKPHLEAALLRGAPLRVKHGIDPTGDKIHIGRAVVLWKLREFQDLGHKIVLIIGDFTAQVGDPSDKLEKRPFLSREQIKANLKNYLPQIGKILNLKKAEVHYNSEWLGKLNFREISELAENFTIQQMIERRNFKERWDRHEEIGLRELMYPLMQGYDSVAIKADVELGGTDQLFNLLAGRKIQERYKQAPQDVLITQMLTGLDGRKMSTSWGNVINIVDPPEEQFGKIMSMRDETMAEYFLLATDLEAKEIRKIMEGKNPKTIKERLGFEVVKRYHGEAVAERAREKFSMLFSKGKIPDDIPALKIKGGEITALQLVLEAGKKLKTMRSRSDAWRLIEQGGFEVSGKQVINPREVIELKGKEKVVRVGKHHFFKIVSG